MLPLELTRVLWQWTLPNLAFNRPVMDQHPHHVRLRVPLHQRLLLHKWIDAHAVNYGVQKKVQFLPYGRRVWSPILHHVVVV